MAQSGTTDLGANIGSGGSGGSGVTSLNTLTGALSLIPGAGILINPSGSTITISSTLAGGTVTSVALADGSTLPLYTISGSPVTSSGTLTFTLNTQSANKVLAGPTTGAAAQPTFRSLVTADLPAGTGTVTSVALTAPASILTVSGSPITTSGTLALTLVNQAQNSFFAGPTSGSGTPTFRAIVPADVPTLNQNTTGTASNVTGVVAIANGGTSQTSAAAARTASGLNIDQRTTFSNTNVTVASTTRYLAQIGTMTAPATVTLPLANSVNPGQLLIIADESGTVGTTNTITLAASGSDTINGSTTKTIRSAYGEAYLISNGSNMWFRPVTGIGSGGTGLSQTPTNGQLLIGNTTTNAYALATLTAGVGISITNGPGTIQINQSPGSPALTAGILGDGVDGAVTISGNTTLTRDMFYSSLTINNGVTLNPGGFIISVDGVLTNNGTIARAGNNGGNAAAAAAGAAGAAIAGTTVGTGEAGAAGGAGGTGNGGSGVTSGAAAGEGGTGGVGGNGGAGNGGATSGGSGGNSGVVTLHYFRNVQASWKVTAVGTFMPTGAGGAGGAAGGGDGTNSGRGGGGGGSAGPCIMILCDTFINNGTVSVAGGNGGNGGAGATGNVGGGAGGGGGGGGKILVLCNTLTTRGTLTAPGGNAGTGSAAAGTGSAGTNGAAGSAGYCSTFEASSGTWTTNNS